MKSIVILGSSGSIGKNALWVASRFPEEFTVYGLSVNSSIKVLKNQIDRFHPSAVCVSDKSAASEIKSAIAGGIELLIGADGLDELVARPDVDIVVNGITGFAGLRATYAAAKAGKRIALANKESMVAGGEFINRTALANNAEIIPVDSEHSAIFQCLKSGNKKEIRRIILTSSGGPFRDLPAGDMADVSPEQALDHPTWNMGRKITIDSASLMNKGLEIIEAAYLFDLPSEKIDVVIHPQSIVHSMVEYLDGSTISQMSKPDMRLPIQYALLYPERKNLDIANLVFDDNFSLDFKPVDNKKFPSIGLARGALAAGKSAPVIFNAADEVAVEHFLRNRIKFTHIFEIVEKTLNISELFDVDGIESIVEADNIGRSNAERIIAEL